MPAPAHKKARSASISLLAPTISRKQKTAALLGDGFVYGADNRIRTDDLVITNDVLYRLSYISVSLHATLIL